MSTDKVKVTKDTKNKTLTIERTFDAPVEKLWRAYTDQEWFEKWWGPEGWKTTATEFDFRLGGRLHYVMECVDKNQGEWYGYKAWSLMVVESIDELNSITIQDNFSDAEGNIDTKMPSQKFIVEFVKEGNKTRLVSRSVLETIEELEQLIQMGMVEGFSSQLNRLERLLEA